MALQPYRGYTPYANPGLSETMALMKAGICQWCKARKANNAGRYCDYCHEALNAVNGLERGMRQHYNDQLEMHKNRLTIKHVEEAAQPKWNGDEIEVEYRDIADPAALPAPTLQIAAPVEEAELCP